MLLLLNFYRSIGFSAFQGESCEIDGKYDSEDFQSLMSAMQVLGFTSDEQDTIFRILASGEFNPIPRQNLEHCHLYLLRRDNYIFVFLMSCYF